MTTAPLTIGQVRSADGTRIGFEQLGTGPALVLVQGAMGTAYHFRRLAEALSDTFTVVVPDRRGRGRSPHPFGPGYTVDDDISDLDAVLRATGARQVFGLSSGADIVLCAALRLPGIERLAVYEPAIFLDGIPRRGQERFAAYAAADDLAGILVSGMKLGELGPAALRAMPDWMVKPAVRAIMRKEAKAGSGEYASMADLARAFRYDFAVVRAMDEAVPRFRQITQPVLLMGGSRSPRYLTRALDRLAQVIPDVTRVEIDGADHAVAWNADPRRNPHGDPQAVADRLKGYLL
jgi:pimeloyl-ACP methyl ester carboxylesterase